MGSRQIIFMVQKLFLKELFRKIPYVYIRYTPVFKILICPRAILVYEKDATLISRIRCLSKDKQNVLKSF